MGFWVVRVGVRAEGFAVPVIPVSSTFEAILWLCAEAQVAPFADPGFGCTVAIVQGAPPMP
jgi:hypothetical protein